MTIMPPPTIHMTPEAFIAWRQSLGLNRREASQALGIAKNTLRTYESGKHLIPKYVALACEHLAARRNVDLVAA